MNSAVTLELLSTMSHRQSPYAALHTAHAHTCPGNGAGDREFPSDQDKLVADTPPASNNRSMVSSVATAPPPYVNKAPSSATPLPNGYVTFDNSPLTLPRKDSSTLTATAPSRRSDRMAASLPSSLPSIPSVDSLHSLSSSVTLPVLEPLYSVLPGEPASHNNYNPSKELRTTSSPSPANSHNNTDFSSSTPLRAHNETAICNSPLERSETNPRTAFSWHRDDPETWSPDAIPGLLGTCAPRRLRRMRNLFTTDDTITDTSTGGTGLEQPLTADDDHCLHVRQPELVADDNATTRDPAPVHQSSMIDKSVGTEHASHGDPRALARPSQVSYPAPDEAKTAAPKPFLGTRVPKEGTSSEVADEEAHLEFLSSCTALTPGPLTARQRRFVCRHITPNVLIEHGAALAAGRLYLGIKREYRYITLFGREIYVGCRDRVTWFSDRCRHFDNAWHPATDCRPPCFLDLDECLLVTEETLQRLPRRLLRRIGYDRYVRRG